MKIKCYDLAEPVINEATKRFAPFFKLNSEDVPKFESYCNAIDRLVEPFAIEALEVNVDEITMNVEISFESPCVQLHADSGTKLFLILANLANSMRISCTEESLAKVTLVFPPLWYRE